jgi:hypothetical protein
MRQSRYFRIRIHIRYFNYILFRVIAIQFIYLVGLQILLYNSLRYIYLIDVQYQDIKTRHPAYEGYIGVK